MAHGDHAAFEQLFSQLSGPVYAMALAVIRDRSQAEEIAQDVFTEIWRTAVRYDPSRGGVITWALTIARRRAIDRVRAVASDSRREQQHASIAWPRDLAGDVWQEAAERDELQRGLSTLTEHQRQLVELAYFGGLTHADIAARLDIPIGTVKSRLRTALARLRENLQDGR